MARGLTDERRGAAAGGLERPDSTRGGQGSGRLPVAVSRAVAQESTTSLK